MSSGRSIRRVGPCRDRGFTLPEVLITIVLIGLIAGVLSAVFTVIVRTQPPTEARVDDARSLLGLTNWFPADVNSTPVQPVASASPDWWNFDPGASSGCSGAPAGDNLIRLRWIETSGSTTTYEANYRLVDDGGWRVQRITCQNGGTGEVQNLTAVLPPPSANPVTVMPIEALIDVGGVDVWHVIGASIEVTTLDGEEMQLDALSENPNESLSPTPTAVTTSSTSTSLPNFPPEAADIGVTLTIGATGLVVDLPVTDPDSAPPVLSYVSDSNTNPDVTVAQTGPLQLELTATGGSDGFTYSFSYDVTDGTSTVSGTIFVTLQASGSPSTSTTTTTTTTTTVPCTVASLTVAPSPVENQPKQNGNNDTNSALTEEVDAVVSGLNGDCSGLQVRWSFRADPYPPAQEQSRLFGASTTITFESLATERWEDGTHTMYLFDGNRGVSLGVSANLVVT